MPLSKELQHAVNLFLAKIDEINPYDPELQNPSQTTDSTSSTAQNNFRQYCNIHIFMPLDISYGRTDSLLSRVLSEGLEASEEFFLQLLQNKQRIVRLILVQQYYPHLIMHILISWYCAILNTSGDHFLVRQQFESFFFGVLDKNPTLLRKQDAYKDSYTAESMGPFGNKTSWSKKWDHIFPLYFRYLASQTNPSEPNAQEKNEKKSWREKSLTQKIETFLENIKIIWKNIKPNRTFEDCFPKTNTWLDEHVSLVKKQKNAQIDVFNPIQSISEEKTIDSLELGLSKYMRNMNINNKNVTPYLLKSMAYAALMKDNRVMSAIFTALLNSRQHKHYQKNPILSELRTNSEFKSQLIVKAAANKRRNPNNATTSGIDYLIQEHTSSFFRRGRTHSGDVMERIALAKPLLSSECSNEGIGSRFLNETLPTRIQEPLSENATSFIKALANLLDRMEKRNKEPVKINLVFESLKTLIESLKILKTPEEILAKIDIWEEEGHHCYHDKILTNKALLNENRNSWWKKKTTQLMEDFLQLKAELEVVKQNAEQNTCVNG